VFKQRINEKKARTPGNYWTTVVRRIAGHKNHTAQHSDARTSPILAQQRLKLSHNRFVAQKVSDIEGCVPQPSNVSAGTVETVVVGYVADVDFFVQGQVQRAKGSNQ